MPCSTVRAGKTIEGSGDCRQSPRGRTGAMAPLYQRDAPMKPLDDQAVFGFIDNEEPQEKPIPVVTQRGPDKFRNLDLIGCRFGKLIIVSNPRPGFVWKARRVVVDCRCDCGSAAESVSIAAMYAGYVKSCGCMRENHGEGRTRLYCLWSGMKGRCENPNAQAFPDYGARGIRVCPSWSRSFAAFREWSHSHGYRQGLTLDRIDNDGDYRPDNCRWITRAEQARNRSNNVYLTVDGVTKLMVVWLSDPRVTVSATTISCRIKRGWPHGLALFSPAGTWLRHHNDETNIGTEQS